MPQHLVERINASLAAEQDQRAAALSGASVTPLMATTRRRPGRVVLAIAGVAAAVALVAVAGGNMFHVNQQATLGSSTALASTSGDQSNPASQSLAAKAPARDSSKDGETFSASGVQILLTETGTRYTRADFVTQARTMSGAALKAAGPQALSAAGSAATNSGLAECLSAIGVRGAQAVRADVAAYEGQPAVIIVVTTNGRSMGYVVGRQCSHADATELRTATPLP
jgi:hypothetical protein